MRMFSIPIELDGEEKTFGGVATIRQVIYIVVTLILTVTAFFVMKSLKWYTVVNVLICTPILMLGVCLAFVRVHETRLDQYMLFLVRYHMRPRIFILKGGEE